MTISPCNSQNCPYIVKQRSTVGNLLTFLFLQAVIFLLATLALRAVGRADVQTQAFVQKFTKNQPLAYRLGNTMSYTKDNDKLYRYLFKERAVRGEWVRLNNTFTETLNTHHYPKAVQNLLGEILVATSLLTATMKFNGTITVQIQGDGPLKLAVVNGNDQQQLRALARVQADIADNATLSEMIGNGVLVISIIPTDGERYQGVIALDKPTIRECLEDYFERSEQLKTHLIIRNGEYEGKAVAGGMLLQIMPDGTGSRDDFEHLATLTETVKDEELFGLEAEELLYRLYHEEQVEVYPPQDTEFKCGCSRERSGSALLLVPADEIEEMLAEKQGVIDMQCECCGTQYFFDKAAIEDFKEEAEKLSSLGLN